MGRSHAGGVPDRGCETNGTGSGSSPIAVLIPALLGLLLVAFLLPGCGEGSEDNSSDSMTTSTITEVPSTGDAVQAAVPAAELSDVEPGQVLEIISSDATGRTQRFLVDPDGRRIRVEDIGVPRAWDL